MAGPEPIPPELDRAARAWRRFKRLMSRMAVAATVAMLLALVYLRSEGRPIPVDMMIAAMAAIGLAILLGTAVMGLVFLSKPSGRSGEEERNDRR